tara:strand:+ start:7442 stop:8065 length:624 start_codon:yes stop_codon:yes gene_type:complete
MRDMKEANNVEWTDGAGKVLSTLGALLSKAEKASNPDDVTYTSDPRLMVMDLETGATVLLETEPHTGGRTKGHGYVKEAGFEQNIPMKVPLTLQRNILLDMIVGMLVPAGSDEAGPLAKAAYTRIAEALKEGLENNINTDEDLAKYWKKKYAKHAKLVDEISAQINDMTKTKMTGAMLCKMQATAVTEAKLDPDEVQSLLGVRVVSE